MEKSYELGIEELLPIAKVFGSLEKIVRESDLGLAKIWLGFEQEKINKLLTRKRLIELIDEGFRLQTSEEMYTQYQLETLF